ncbi:MAG: ATP-binding region ATPase domain protein, partial [Gemmatimonadetes bacterium]|nr:ATP-binding region ATPase domain protein [Gemmatimonadota bacterium]
VINLVSNATKFTAPGGRIRIMCERRDDGRVALSVHDTGSGIPGASLESIFEPFVQVGRSLTATHQGTGLGLAISRDLARAMHGDLEVESEVGVGSTFTLTLPRDPDQRETAEQGDR